MQEERRVTPALIALIGVAESSFRQWVKELRGTGRFATDPAALQAALRTVEGELPGGVPAAAMPLPPVPRAAPEVPETRTPIGPVSMPPRAPSSPADAGAGFAPFDVDIGAPIEYPAASAESSATVDMAYDTSAADASLAPDLELVDFPELGAPIGDDAAPSVTVLEESVAETIDVGLPTDPRDASKPLLRVVADNTGAHAGLTEPRGRSQHGPELMLLTDAPRASEPIVGVEPEEVTVGAVTLSAALWRILCDEADQNVAVLQHEVSILQFDPDYMPVVAMVRASHTLCGIHRTGGIALIATTARALEQALLALEERGAPFPSTAQPVLARATAGLAHFVGRVKQREGFTASDEREAADITAELDEMRRDALANLPVVDPLMPIDGVQESHSPAAADSDDRSTSTAADDDARAIATAADDARSIATAPHKPIDTHAGSAAVDRPAAAAPADSPMLLTHWHGRDDVSSRVDEPVTEPPESAAAPATSEAPPSEPFVEYPPLADHIVAETAASAPEPPAVSIIEEAPALEQAWPVAAPIAPPASTPTPPAAASDESLLDISDDIDDTILSIFLEEANELFPQASEEVRTWRRVPDDPASAARLRRTLHTLKGSARMAGAMRLGELAHRMEARLTIGDVPVAPSVELFEALDTDIDRIAFVLDALREGKGSVPLPWLAQADAAAATTATAAAAKAIDTTSVPAAPVPAAAPKPSRSDNVEVETAKAMLRVRADIVDQLVNEAGEVAITRARVEGELRALKANLLELTSSVIRLRSQVREIELQAETQIQSRMSHVSSAQEDFDPLELDRYTRFQELTRSFAEGVNDVSTVQQALLKNLDDADAALLAQARLSRDVQQRLFAIRTVPFHSLSERLYRILRKTARELDKRANLEIHGGQTELDRSVLEKLVGPLEHLLRNALDHGIETRSARVAAGKSETGEIELTVRQVGNEIAIELSDDGHGIDFDRVRERAVAQGLLAATGEPTIHQLVEFLFDPGFTTAAEVTQISGRGIGMDVVRNEVVALGGRVDVHTQPGKGTRFNLFLPLTLAVAQSVLVRAGGRMWAIPAPMVEQVQQIKADVLQTLYADGQVHWQGRAWPFHYLPRLLGDNGSLPETMRYNAVLLIRSGQGTTAIHVDEMIGNQEVVVKNIGPQLARVPGISGATVLGTGEIVLIINPVQLAQRPGIVRYDPVENERITAELRQAAAASARKLVMVVDDSLTVRKFTTRLLTREGFEVVTARDGIDALKLLSDHAPDAILLDIEMPRMDGFEFAKTIKGDPKTAGIPVIMITSRTADKHRNRATELGVQHFLGKPYQEDELLQRLRSVTSPDEAGQAADAMSTTIH